MTGDSTSRAKVVELIRQSLISDSILGHGWSEKDGREWGLSLTVNDHQSIEITETAGECSFTLTAIDTSQGGIIGEWSVGEKTWVEPFINSVVKDGMPSCKGFGHDMSGTEAEIYGRWNQYDDTQEVKEEQVERLQAVRQSFADRGYNCTEICTTSTSAKFTLKMS